MRLRIKSVVVTSLFLSCMFIILPALAKFCGQPLGVARRGDAVLPDSRMKASSEDLSHPASKGRLKDSGWAPRSTDEDPYPYLQIDLVNLYLVCGVKVQGCTDYKGKPAWVTRYRVQVSPEKNFWDSWNYLKPEFYGGKSAKEIIYSEAKERKVGQYVKIFPVSFKNWPCMKVEVFGKSYIENNAEVFVLFMAYAMMYKPVRVIHVNGSHVYVNNSGKTKHYNIRPNYTQVIPKFKPLKTELKVDTCVVTSEWPYFPNSHPAGRIHEVKNNSYLIEYLMYVDFHKEKKIVANHSLSELVVVYSAWCKKIEYSVRGLNSGNKSDLCLGTITRVDSDLVFKPKGSPFMTTISYINRPPLSDYVSNHAVVPSEVTPGQTVLFYPRKHGQHCLSKGKVLSFNKTYKSFSFFKGMSRLVTDVRYSKGHGLEQCGKDEKHCHDSRIPFKVNRRRCPNLQTWNGTKCLDVDECQYEAACAINAKCTNTKGSYRCECHKGYRGNPDIVCQDVDECKGFNCGHGQNCTNTPGSFFCSCSKGFGPDKSGSCTDIDECADDDAISSFCGTYNYLSCQNLPGNYTCRCKMGYDFNIRERKCQDIDECEKKHPCVKNAECINNEGSFRCICAKGYSGYGLYFCDAITSSAIRKDIKVWNLVFAALVVPVLRLL